MQKTRFQVKYVFQFLTRKESRFRLQVNCGGCSLSTTKNKFGSFGVFQTLEFLGFTGLNSDHGVVEVVYTSQFPVVALQWFDMQLVGKPMENHKKIGCHAAGIRFSSSFLTFQTHNFPFPTSFPRVEDAGPSCVGYDQPQPHPSMTYSTPIS